MPIFGVHPLVCRLCTGIGLCAQKQAQNPWGTRSRNLMPPDLEYAEELRRQQALICGRWESIDLRAELWDIPSLTGSEDHVITDHCLVRQPSVVACLLEIWRVLRPGGHLVVLEPEPRELGERKPDNKQHHLEDFQKKHTAGSHPEVPGVGRRGHIHVADMRAFSELWLLDTPLRGKFGLLWRASADSPDAKICNSWMMIFRAIKEK